MRIICPDCNGDLWEIPDDEKVLEGDDWRCDNCGTVFSNSYVVIAQDNPAEQMRANGAPRLPVMELELGASADAAEQLTLA